VADGQCGPLLDSYALGESKVRRPGAAAAYHLSSPLHVWNRAVWVAQADPSVSACLAIGYVAAGEWAEDGREGAILATVQSLGTSPKLAKEAIRWASGIQIGGGW
jgi:hypothetical protein